MKENQNKIKQQFFDSLKRGTGEAYLIFKNNPNINFSNLIIKGAITNFAYDQQCEGSRADYIYRFIKKDKQKDKIVNAVLAKLQEEKKDYWSLWQMCDLAVMFHKDGFEEAKSALYNRFEKNTIEGYEFCGQNQLIEIDGLKGLLKVAEIIGKEIIEEDCWEDSWHVDNFQKKHKELSVYAELKKAGKKNKFIAAYYQSILENKWSLPKGGNFVKYSYATVKEKIESNKFRFISVDRANDLSTEEVEQLADELLVEKNKNKSFIFGSLQKGNSHLIIILYLNLLVARIHQRQDLLNFQSMR